MYLSVLTGSVYGMEAFKLLWQFHEQFLLLVCIGAARAKICKARSDDDYAKALQA